MEEGILNFHTIRCCICESVLLNLPEEEIQRLNGLTFRCESCGHKLILNGESVSKVICTDSFTFLKFDLNI